MSLILKTHIVAAATCDPVLPVRPVAPASSPTVDACFPDASKQSKHANYANYTAIVHKTLSKGAQNDNVPKNATRVKNAQLNASGREASRSPLGNVGNNQDTTPIVCESDPNSQPLPLAAEDHIIAVTEQFGNHGGKSLPDTDSTLLSSSSCGATEVEPAVIRCGYVSAFLQTFAERPLPTRLGVQLVDLQEWMKDILITVSAPKSEEAKSLLKEKPFDVLFAQQLHLVLDCGEHIEVMAQRAVNRDYYYDFLIRMYGDSKAREWITGRYEGDGHRRKSAQRGSLNMRKRVLIGEGYKVYHALMETQMEQLTMTTIA